MKRSVIALSFVFMVFVFMVFVSVGFVSAEKDCRGYDGVSNGVAPISNSLLFRWNGVDVCRVTENSGFDIGSIKSINDLVRKVYCLSEDSSGKLYKYTITYVDGNDGGGICREEELDKVFSEPDCRYGESLISNSLYVAAHYDNMDVSVWGGELICQENPCIVKNYRYSRGDFKGPATFLGVSVPDSWEICREKITDYVEPPCGNGKLEKYKGEECDDGNLIAGDGCDENCMSEEAPKVDPCISDQVMFRLNSEDKSSSNTYGSGRFRLYKVMLRFLFGGRDTSFGSANSEDMDSNFTLWNAPNYDVSVCFEDVFGEPYIGPNPHDCTDETNPKNVLFWVSNDTNSQVSSTKIGEYNIPICYGDLVCSSSRSGCMTSDQKIVAKLSNEVDAHVFLANNSNYNVSICCRRAA